MQHFLSVLIISLFLILFPISSGYSLTSLSNITYASPGNQPFVESFAQFSVFPFFAINAPTVQGSDGQIIFSDKFTIGPSPTTLDFSSNQSWDHTRFYGWSSNQAGSSSAFLMYPFPQTLAIGLDNYIYQNLRVGAVEIFDPKGYNVEHPLESLSFPDKRTITGGSRSDQFGFSLAVVSDHNSDINEDLLVGAPGYQSKRGIVYLIFTWPGSSSTYSINSLSSNEGKIIYGVNDGDQFGYAISAGSTGSPQKDINGDGIPDHLVSAPYASYLTRTQCGKVYFLPGPIPVDFSSTVESIGTSVTIVGSNDNEQIGLSIDIIASINGDIFDDILIGAPQIATAYVVYGATSYSNPIDLKFLDGINGFSISSDDMNDRFGFSVSSAGDFNQDGFNDILIGAPESTLIGGAARVGAAYILFGGDNMLTSYSLTDFDDKRGIQFSTMMTSAQTGYAVTRLPSAFQLGGKIPTGIMIASPFSAVPTNGFVHLVPGSVRWDKVPIQVAIVSCVLEAIPTSFPMTHVFAVILVHPPQLLELTIIPVNPALLDLLHQILV